MYKNDADVNCSDVVVVVVFDKVVE